MNGPAQRGALSVWMGVAIVLVIGIAALALWPETEPTGDARVVAAEEADEHTAAELYTCGMHPQVLSEQPGTCPICQMDLTPVKVETGAAAASAGGGERKVKYWRAPMDPSFISDRPGKSPMGMDLVPVYEDESAEADDTAISISPVVVQNMGVRTALVERKPVVRTVRTVGSIDYNEQNVRDVTTKFDGWIEELYVDYTGQHVEKGMPLFRVYSPELYSSQEEYLLAVRNRNAVSADVLAQAARDMQGLAESARLRLELFDISADQIDELAKRGKPAKTMTILSPHTGIVVEKMARDGMQVRSGMKLYTIADLSRVWVYVEIYENEVSFVKLGQDAKMELSYLPGEVFRGKVIYVYPFVQTETRTVKVRLEFDNPHLQLKPGMFADVQIEADLGRDSLQVPRSAVIDTGRRQVAFVAVGEGRFEARQVRTGVSLDDDRVEILSGLSEAELVVTSGQFLLDSESKLREAVLKMIEQKKAGAVPATTAAVAVPGGEGADHEGHAHAVPTPFPDVGSAADLANLIEPIIERYLELQDVLSHDHIGRVGPTVQALEPPLAAFLASTDDDLPPHRRARQHVSSARETVGLMRDRSMDAVRSQFSALSKDITALLAIVGPANLETQLYAFYCPMAGSGWIQRGEQPRNPYYGFSMHQCGDSVSLLKDH